MEVKNITFELYHAQDYMEVERIILGFAESYKGEIEKNSVGLLLVELADEIIHKEPDNPHWLIKQKLISLVGIDLLQAYVNYLKNKAELREGIVDELKLQLTAVAAFLRRVPGLKVLTVKDTSGLISTELKTDFEKNSLVYSLREYLHDKEGKELSWQIISYLCSDATVQKKEYDWYDVFTETIYLHLIFDRFFFVLDPKREALMLKHYFYKSIVVGVPIRQILSDELSDSRDLIDYLNLDKELLEMLQANEESVVIDTSNTYKKFIDLVKEFLSVAGDSEKDEKKQLEFLQTILNNKLTPKIYLQWLQEALSIYVRVKNARLIEKNSAGELPEKIRQDKDLFELNTWLIDKSTWPKIADYYKEPDPFVTVKSFLGQFKTVADLTKEESLEHFLDFNEFLHKHKILSAEEDIIFFDEKENKFVWI